MQSYITKYWSIRTASHVTSASKRVQTMVYSLSLCKKSIETRKKEYKHWTNYIYVLFPRFINNPPAGKERDCHDREIADSRSKKKNVIDGDVGLKNTIWDKKNQ